MIRGRRFDYTRKLLPDALARIERFTFATPDEKRLISQIQGRTYASMFALVERCISAKMLEVSRSHALGSQAAMGSLVRLTDEELKHQELFRRLETMMAEEMPAGYEMEWQREDARVTPAERDQGVTELIELVGAIDGMLQLQAQAEAEYFLRIAPRQLSEREVEQLRAGFLSAYRWQYIVTGAQNQRFTQLLASLCTPQQLGRVTGVLAPLMAS